MWWLYTDKLYKVAGVNYVTGWQNQKNTLAKYLRSRTEGLTNTMIYFTQQ